MGSDLRRSAYQLPNGFGGEASVTRSDGLIEDRKRIAYRAVAGFRQQGQGVFVGFDLLASNEIF